MALRTQAERLAYAIGDDDRAGLGGVDEHAERDVVTEAEHGVALTHGAPRDGGEHVERFVACCVGRVAQAVELPEDDRHRLQLAPRRGDDLLEHDGQVTLAHEARERVDLPIVGRSAGRRQVGGVAFGLLELAGQVAGLDPRPPQRRVGPGSRQIGPRPHSGSGDGDDRGDDRERHFVEDHRGDAGHDRGRGQHGEDGERPLRAGLHRGLGHRRAPSAASSANSPMICVRRKSLGV
jgi:hypothetical protein